MTMGELVETLKKMSIAQGVPEYDEIIYKQEIKGAIKEINRCRRFTPTKERLYDDKYEDLIIPLAISSISKYGAEGETNHSENGVNRSYGSDGKYPISILKSIIPLVK